MSGSSSWSPSRDIAVLRSSLLLLMRGSSALDDGARVLLRECVRVQ